jgi:signal peptidase I
MGIIFDFSLVLVVLAALTGLIWAADHWLLRPGRPADSREPIVVEYSRSFFPVILAVLVIRSFLFEPFRIPSDSMMPTLLDGDFIFVSKFSYGLRLPVLNTRILDVGSPQRGDVIVFRKPREPSVNYIKRLVGLPGDRVEIRGDAIWVNGEEMRVRDTGLYGEDACYHDFRQATEQLGEHEHRIMYCPVSLHYTDLYRDGCSTKRAQHDCGADPARPANPAGDPSLAGGVYVVPPGYYFFMGDNRDNSGDSRFPDLGYVPEENLVGKAERIWLNISLPPGAAVRRIGMAIR